MVTSVKGNENTTTYTCLCAVYIVQNRRMRTERERGTDRQKTVTYKIYSCIVEENKKIEIYR